MLYRLPTRADCECMGGMPGWVSGTPPAPPKLRVRQSAGLADVGARGDFKKRVHCIVKELVQTYYLR